MRILVTGSSGHLGEGLVKVLRSRGHTVYGLDIIPSPETTHLGSVTNLSIVDQCVSDVEYIIHSATLHKPHVSSHDMQAFIDTNITGTLNLLKAALTYKIKGFIFTSTTSTFGLALEPSKDGKKAIWVSEELKPIPKNIYGVSKIAAEDLCQLFHQDFGLPCLVLKTSRFFQETDDMKHKMPDFSDENIKANEYLFSRVDLEDVVDAHLLALQKVENLGFEKFIITGSTPLTQQDCDDLMNNAPEVVAGYFPEYKEIYQKKGWKMFPRIKKFIRTGKLKRN